MKKIFFAFSLMLLLSACRQQDKLNDENIQSTIVAGIAQTMTESVTETPAYTLTPEPTKTPALTKTNTPVPTPIEYSGIGSTLLNVNYDFEPVIIEFETNTDYCDATPYNTTGSIGNFSLMEMPRGPSYTLILFTNYGNEQESIKTFDIQCDGEWKLNLSPISTVRMVDKSEKISGFGQEIIQLTGSNNKRFIAIDGSNSEFGIWVDAATKFYFESIGYSKPYSVEKKIIDVNTKYIRILTNGNWSIEFTEE
ncbi:MAG: membrane lipoprotein lipid attachment site-containing protein [Bacteroidetes bacterium]|jgi:hypothetical protein|nr:membrane lipoprotein lipid attachment site-containing protein [Bacteroidota bacterium]